MWDGLCIYLYSVLILRKWETTVTERLGLVSQSQKRERIRPTEVIGWNWPLCLRPLSFCLHFISSQFSAGSCVTWTTRIICISSRSCLNMNTCQFSLCLSEMLPLIQTSCISGLKFYRNVGLLASHSIHWLAIQMCTCLLKCVLLAVIQSLVIMFFI
jgi:hypothetical protein